MFKLFLDKFKVREATNSKSLENEVPLLNADVMEKISEVSDFATLKSLRLVSKSWESVSTPVLKKRSKIVLKVKGTRKNQFQNFDSETKVFQPIKAVKISIIDKRRLSNYDKYSLPSIAKSQDTDKILKALSNSLENLEIVSQEDLFWPYLPDKDTKFPSLVKFSYDNSKGDTRQEEINKFYSNAPKIQELIFNTTFLNNQMFLEINLLQKLNSLTIVYELWHTDLEILIQFPAAIFKNLELCLKGFSQDYSTNFRELLEKQKDSLVSLTLVDSRKEINFPGCFPKLKKLSIKFENLDARVNIGEFEDSQILDYSKTFPALEVLALDFDVDLMNKQRDYDGIYNVFKAFLHKRAVCRTLRLLELNFEGYNKSYLTGRIYWMDYDWYKTNFPNARANFIKLKGKNKKVLERWI